MSPISQRDDFLLKLRATQEYLRIFKDLLFDLEDELSKLSQEFIQLFPQTEEEKEQKLFQRTFILHLNHHFSSDCPINSPLFKLKKGNE